LLYTFTCCTSSESLFVDAGDCDVFAVGIASACIIAITVNFAVNFSTRRKEADADRSVAEFGREVLADQSSSTSDRGKGGGGASNVNQRQ